MIISLIAACSTNRVIGVDNDLPWRVPADMRFFMRTTKGHYVIMGRKTFESLGVPLKNRTNIVVTRDPFFIASGVMVTHSIAEAIDLAIDGDESEAFVIGGGEIYRQSMDLADKIYLTEIDTVIEDGDAFFPEIDPGKWDLVSEDPHDADDKNEFAYNFKTFIKKTE